MSTMQAFYVRLFSTQDPYWISLARLTRATLNQVNTFRSEITWSIWA